MHVTPHWAKLDALGFLNIYDYVLYIDSDIYIKQDSPNILSFVHTEDTWDLSMCVHTNRYKNDKYNKNDFLRYASIIGDNNISYDSNSYFNTGVIIFSKRFLEKRNIISSYHEVNNPPTYEQDFFNYLGYKGIINVFHLPEGFNYIQEHSNSRIEEEAYSESNFFIHFACCDKKTERIREFVDHINKTT
jgi:hypothetical protein